MLQQILVPPIHFWNEEYNGKVEKITAAVLWKGMRWGLSFPAAENMVRRNMDKKILLNHMKDIVSVLSLHGDKILDIQKQIDLKLLNEQEAIRFTLDPFWEKNVNAVSKLTKVKEISQSEAIKLKLCPKKI